MKEIFKSMIKKVFCKHEYEVKECLGTTYLGTSDVIRDIKTYVYMLECSKCGKTKIVFSYIPPKEEKEK